MSEDNGAELLAMIENPQQPTAAKSEPELQCPECAAQGIVRTYKDPRGLGSHRAMQHGIVGTSYARNQQQKLRQQKLKTRRPARIRGKGEVARGGFPCPECAAQGIDRRYAFKRTLGTHRRGAHGVVGTAASSIYQRKKAAEGRGTRRNPEPARRPVGRPRNVVEAAQPATLTTFARFCPMCRCPIHRVNAALQFNAGT